MNGSEGKSEFLFPETLRVFRGGAEGHILVEGKQDSLFPANLPRFQGARPDHVRV